MTARITLTLPADWRDAFATAADRQNLSVNEWIRKQCRRGLTPAERAELSEPAPRGNPQFSKDRS